MSVRSMAEMMILQAMEDLESPEFRAESLEFFSGGRFAECARLANMGHDEMLKMIEIVRTLVAETKTTRESERSYIYAEIESSFYEAKWPCLPCQIKARQH